MGPGHPTRRQQEARGAADVGLRHPQCSYSEGTLGGLAAWLPMAFSLCPRPPPPHACSCPGPCHPSFLLLPVELVLRGGGAGASWVSLHPPPVCRPPHPLGEPGLLLLATTRASPCLLWSCVPHFTPPNTSFLSLHSQTQPLPLSPAPRLCLVSPRTPRPLVGLSSSSTVPVSLSLLGAWLSQVPTVRLSVLGPASLSLSQLCLAPFLCDYNF